MISSRSNPISASAASTRPLSARYSLRDSGSAPTDETVMNWRAPAARAARAKPSTASWSTASNAGQLPALRHVVPSAEMATSTGSGPLIHRGDGLADVEAGRSAREQVKLVIRKQRDEGPPGQPGRADQRDAHQKRSGNRTGPINCSCRAMAKRSVMPAI